MAKPCWGHWSLPAPGVGPGATLLVAGRPLLATYIWIPAGNPVPTVAGRNLKLKPKPAPCWACSTDARKHLLLCTPIDAHFPSEVIGDHTWKRGWNNLKRRNNMAMNAPLYQSCPFILLLMAWHKIQSGKKHLSHP